MIIRKNRPTPDSFIRNMKLPGIMKKKCIDINLKERKRRPHIRELASQVLAEEKPGVAGNGLCIRGDCEPDPHGGDISACCI